MTISLPCSEKHVEIGRLSLTRSAARMSAMPTGGAGSRHPRRFFRIVDKRAVDFDQFWLRRTQLRTRAVDSLKERVSATISDKTRLYLETWLSRDRGRRLFDRSGHKGVGDARFAF